MKFRENCSTYYTVARICAILYAQVDSVYYTKYSEI